MRQTTYSEHGFTALVDGKQKGEAIVLNSYSDGRIAIWVDEGKVVMNYKQARRLANRLIQIVDTEEEES